MARSVEHHGLRFEPDGCHAQHGQQRHADERDVRARKRHREQRARGAGQVGACHGAQQATGQHQRHGLLAVVRGRQLGGRKAVQATVGAVVARHQRSGAQQPEAAAERRPGTQRGRCHGHGQPDLERHLAPPARLRARHQRGGQRPAHHVAHHRQRGHPAKGRQLQAHQAIDGNEDNVVGEEKALAQRQQPQVLVHDRAAPGLGKRKVRKVGQRRRKSRPRGYGVRCGGGPHQNPTGLLRNCAPPLMKISGCVGCPHYGGAQCCGPARGPRLNVCDGTPEIDGGGAA